MINEKYIKDNDIEKAKVLAKDMVNYYAMGDYLASTAVKDILEKAEQQSIECTITDYFYTVRCEDVYELKGILSLGKVGLPYISDWAISNLERQNSFPVFVNTCYNKFGIILNNIDKDRPTDKYHHVITYYEFVNRIENMK